MQTREFETRVAEKKGEAGLIGRVCFFMDPFSWFGGAPSANEIKGYIQQLEYDRDVIKKALYETAVGEAQGTVTYAERLKIQAEDENKENDLLREKESVLIDWEKAPSNPTFSSANELKELKERLVKINEELQKTNITLQTDQNNLGNVSRETRSNDGVFRRNLLETVGLEQERLVASFKKYSKDYEEDRDRYRDFEYEDPINAQIDTAAEAEASRRRRNALIRGSLTTAVVTYAFYKILNSRR